MEIFGGNLPPEIVAVIREHQEMHEMTFEDQEHAIKQLMADLDKDQLQTLDLMLGRATDAKVSAYFRGRIEAILELEHDVCPCGRDHNPEIEFSTKDSAPNTDEEPTLPEVAMTVEKAMEEYGLKRCDMPGGYSCKNCGQYYVSIEDRMRREPGVKGCGGCQDKAKWG